MCALVIAFFINPAAEEITFCLYNQLGIEFCPGCGLGRSMALALRGNLQASLQMHPAGIIAILVILYRIVFIISRNHKIKKEAINEKDI